MILGNYFRLTLDHFPSHGEIRSREVLFDALRVLGKLDLVEPIHLQVKPKQISFNLDAPISPRTRCS